MGLIIKDELNSGLHQKVSNAYLNINKCITLVKNKDSDGNICISAVYVIQVFETKESERPFHKEKIIAEDCNLSNLYKVLYDEVKLKFNETEDDL